MSSSDVVGRPGKEYQGVRWRRFFQAYALEGGGCALALGDLKMGSAIRAERQAAAGTGGTASIACQGTNAWLGTARQKDADGQCRQIPDGVLELRGWLHWGWAWSWCPVAQASACTTVYCWWGITLVAQLQRNEGAMPEVRQFAGKQDAHAFFSAHASTAIHSAVVFLHIFIHGPIAWQRRLES